MASLLDEQFHPQSYKLTGDRIEILIDWILQIDSPVESSEPTSSPDAVNEVSVSEVGIKNLTGDKTIVPEPEEVYAM